MAWAEPLATVRSSLRRHVAAESHAPQSRPRMGIVLHDFALGGTERIAVRLANKWNELGVEVEIFCGTREGPLLDLVHPAVMISVPAEPIGRSKGSLRRLGAAARMHFDRYPVDALYVPGNTHWPVVRHLAMIAANKRPRIIAQISAALEKPQRGRWRQKMFELRMRQKLAGADRVVSMCREASITASRMLGGRDIPAIPLPALEDERCSPMRRRPKVAPVILCASRLVPGKGVEQLVEAFAHTDHATARLVIAGSGPNLASIRALVDDLGLSRRVEFTGYVPDIRPLLDEADFFVMPSQHEGYGAVIIEALAAGRPVLSTHCSPAVDELLSDPVAGMVVPVGDTAALARGMEQMLARAATDPAALATRVERFRIGPVARRYLSLVGITPGFDGQPARLLVAANDPSFPASDCATGKGTL